MFTIQMHKTKTYLHQKNGKTVKVVTNVNLRKLSKFPDEEESPQMLSITTSFKAIVLGASLIKYSGNSNIIDKVRVMLWRQMVMALNKTEQ